MLLGSISDGDYLSFWCFLIIFKYFICIFCNPEQNDIKKWTVYFTCFLYTTLLSMVCLCVREG